MPTLLVKVNTNNVPDSPAKWKAGEVVAVVADDHEFGSAEIPSAGNFYHITITDKTLEEVQAYIAHWGHNPTVRQVQNQGNRRLIEVTSDMVSATGKNAFTREGVEQLLEDIGGEYDSHTQNSFRFSITATKAERDQIIDEINEAVHRIQYARRRWYIVAAGMNYLASNGGAVSGTASQVSGYLRDGLLD